MLRNGRQEEEKKRPSRLSAKSLVSLISPLFSPLTAFSPISADKKEGVFFAPTKKTFLPCASAKKKKRGERKSDATLRTLRVRSIYASLG